ncbi:hypothetical protein CCS40_03870 [Candidatus Williamhamiltonella defendens]|nr:hypothetical protein CCS40_03870 [Candidatus Hamiltonella defensa]
MNVRKNSQRARYDTCPAARTIPVSDTQAYRQFGNSVVMPVMQEVARIMTPHVRAQMHCPCFPDD